jgi:predicted PurR-regulated permease PerM
LDVEIHRCRRVFIKRALLQHWQQAGNIATIVLSTISKSSYGIIVFLIDLLLVPVVAFYLLRDWDRILTKTELIFPRSIAGIATNLLIQCDEVLSAFFRGQLSVMLILGIYYTIALWLVGLQLSLLLGILIGVLSIVPYLGFMTGIVLTLIITAVQFQDWTHILYVLIAFALGSILESMFLVPVLVGDKVGLHPVMVIFAILAGGQLFGFLGVLLAIPAAAVILVLVRYFYLNYLNSNFYINSRV